MKIPAMTPEQLYYYFLAIYLSWNMTQFCAEMAARWSSGFNPCC